MATRKKNKAAGADVKLTLKDNRLFIGGKLVEKYKSETDRKDNIDPVVLTEEQIDQLVTDCGSGWDLTKVTKKFLIEIEEEVEEEESGDLTEE